MKKKHLLLFVAFLMAAMSCQKKDIRELRSELDKQKELIAQLQSALNNVNTDIKGLQAIATALQAKVSLVSYTTTANGYELTMSDGSKINLTHGKDGANGTNGKDGINAPVIGLRQDADGNYYWTIGSDWLLQNGQKVKANGTNGTNGNNGTTPLLMVNATSNQWMVSYDNGNNWSVIKDGNGNPVTATGAQGPAGVAGFSITETAATLVITYMGVSYTLPKAGIDPTPDTYKMVLVTSKSLNQSLVLTIYAEPADRADVWIDLNNDKKIDAGEKINDFETLRSYPLNISKTVTIYGKVTQLSCSNNSLTTLDITRNAALTRLECSDNALDKLDVSQNIALKVLSCTQNDLTSLDFSTNILLSDLVCYRNNIKDTRMTAFINSLPNSDVEKNAWIIAQGSATEGNTMPTQEALNNAKVKKWTIRAGNGSILNP